MRSLLAVLLCACSSPAVVPETRMHEMPYEPEPAVYADWEHTPRYRDVTLCVRGDLLPAVELAAERWYRATGIEIAIQCTGRATEDAYVLTRPDGTTGQFQARDGEPDRVWIREDALSWPNLVEVVTHELGHFLAHGSDLAEHHGGIGILSGSSGWVDSITEDDLTLVCDAGRWVCQWMETEDGR